MAPEATIDATRLAKTNAEMGEKLTGVMPTLEKLQRHVFGKRSEKDPSVADEFREAGVEADSEPVRACRVDGTERTAACAHRATGAHPGEAPRQVRRR